MGAKRGLLVSNERVPFLKQLRGDNAEDTAGAMGRPGWLLGGLGLEE